MSITIYHNPACGTSRNTLAMIRQSGEEPEVVESLKTPPSRERLKEVIHRPIDSSQMKIGATPKGVRLCRPSELVL